MKSTKKIKKLPWGLKRKTRSEVHIYENLKISYIHEFSNIIINYQLKLFNFNIQYAMMTILIRLLKIERDHFVCQC
uniref:Putative ovule protein n=1 Tax=Solanum chacoense TaxID=4108 RepID=A0A0V0H4X8_SOLCH